MTFEISKAVVKDTKHCLRREMLAYALYPTNSSRCFVYPQYVAGDDALDPVSIDCFPIDGVFTLAVSGGRTSDDIRDAFGNLVVVRLNMDEPEDFQINYTFQNTQAGSKYHSVINPTMPKGRSLVEFSKFSTHALSSKLMQITEVGAEYDLRKPIAKPIELQRGAWALGTKYILLSQSTVAGRKYFGPFEYSQIDAETVSLKAVADYDYQVAEIPATSFKSKFDVATTSGDTYALFVTADEFDSLFMDAKTHDWITDEELINATGRMAQRSEELSFTKKQVRDLKAALSEATSDEAGIMLTEARRARVSKMLAGPERWMELPEYAKSEAVNNIPPAQLADYVLSNEHFKDFFDLAMKEKNVQERFDAMVREAEEKARAQKMKIKETIEDEKDKLLYVAKKRKEVEADLAAIEEKRDEAREQALIGVGEELEKANAQLAEKNAELDEAASKLEEVKRQASIIQGELTHVMDNFSSEVQVAGRLLESDLLKKLVANLSGSDPNAGGERELAIPDYAINTDEAEKAPREVVEHIQTSLHDKAGRDCSYNEVVNYLTCLTQGYITTFAGLPGSGKTSLVNALAGVLGLKHEGARRFVEVPVERGWTSYTDFVGYYNPLSRHIEKSNPDVYDAFEQMNLEVEEGAAGLPPYLILLDEANLSSIEHYWAPFLRGCDSYERGPMPLSLGGDKALKVPSCLRFAATVNFDHTTEELSPRFLDRSWVITLDSGSMELNVNTSFDADYSNVKAYSYGKLCEVFGANQGNYMSNAVEELLQKVLNIAQEEAFPISLRSQKMIRNYLGTACKLMDTDTRDGKLAPLDYAICQKVLPTINGHADKLKGMIDRFSLELGDLPMTSRCLERMSENARDTGFYQFLL